MEADEVILNDYSMVPQTTYMDYDDYASKRKYTFHNRSKGQVLVCQFCRKEFKYPSKYKEHLRIHTGERPFKCSMCPMSFTQSGARKAHEKLHDNDCTELCEVCGRVFRTRGLLHKHMRSHDPPSIYQPEQILVQKNSKRYCNSSKRYSNVVVKTEVEQEYTNTYELVEYGFIEPEHVEATHKWQVDRLPSVSSDGVVEPESELQLTRLADGRLMVNDEVIEGHFVEEGLTIYPTQLPNGHLVNFLYDEVNDSLEIVEPSEEPADNEETGIGMYPDDTEPDTFKEYNHMHIFDELFHADNSDMPISAAADDIIDFKESMFDVKPVPELLNPPLKVNGVVLADSRPPKMGQSMVDAPLVPVDDKIVKLAALVKEYTRELPTRRRIRYRKPSNLEWIINAVATGKKIEEANPHKRKQAIVKICEHCGLTLKYPSKIEAHMRTHTGEKPFECEICHQKFAVKTTLRMHLRRHLKQKSFACSINNCKRTFICAALLRHHIKTKHCARRRFACLRGCGASFFSNSDREKHEETCFVMDLENPVYQFPDQEEIIYDDKQFYFEGDAQYVDQWEEDEELLQQTF